MKPLFLCFSQNLNYALGWTVIHSLWQAFVVTLLIGITLILLQKKSSKVRYMVAHSGLWSILGIALITFCLYYDFSRSPDGLVVIPETSNFSNAIFSEAPLQEDLNSVAPQTFSWQGFKNYCNNNMYIIVTVWFMGVVAFLLKILGGISYVYYIRNRMNFPADEYWQETLDGLRQKIKLNQYVELVESALVRSPIVVGHIKPMILFPIGAINRLSHQEVEAILAHELAHVIRHDYIFNIIQNVIEALFYFHPAVWWLSSQIRTERENCCDDVAISICGNAVTYAKSLVSVQEMAYYSPQLAMAFAGKSRKKQLLLRIQRILEHPKSTINIMEKFASTSILLLLLLGFIFGSSQLGAASFSTASMLEQEDSRPNGLSLSAHFLKYQYNGELDSIPLDKNMPDGHYSFVNNLYNVDMSIKNQRVVTFKINGLEVDKKDMPKFKNMINQLVRKEEKKDDLLVAAPPLYLDSSHKDGFNKGKVKIIDSKGNLSEIMVTDKGVKQLIIEQPNRAPRKVLLEENGKIVIDGIISSTKSLNQLGWTVIDNGLVPIDGYQSVSTVDVSEEPSCVKDSRKVDCEAKYLDKVQELRERVDEMTQMGITARKLLKTSKALLQIEDQIKDSDNPDYEIIEEELAMVEETLDNLEDEWEEQEQMKESKGSKGSKNNFDWSYDDGNGAAISPKASNKNKEKIFDEWLEKEWVKDGYTKKVKDYRLQWTPDYMYVNKKKVSDEHLSKYIRMHKQITGNDLSAQFTITRISNGK
jgi:beta-lactamase regulating signal transducer with metallopeptidase domain